ncbi:GH36-type glycosyl hydrolase domain-containing protein, partial [Planctomycetota bacterium]
AEGNEYVITRPDTPRPWHNHLANDHYGMKISQTGAGISLHGRERIVNMLYYFMRQDQPGRYVYLADRDSRDVWSINWQPCKKKYDRFECRHGLAHTIITSRRKGIEGSVRYIVPVDEAVEIWTISVRNAGTKPRRISVVPYCEWAQKVGPSHGDDLEYACFSDAAWSKAENMIIAQYHESRPMFEDYVTFMASDFTPSSYETNWVRFVGHETSRARPEALVKGKLSSRDTRADVIIGALQKNITLAPGAEKTFNIMIGLSGERRERSRLVRKFLKKGGPDQAHRKCLTYWDKLCGLVDAKTPDQKLNRTFNYWLKKQAYHCGVGTTIRTYRRGFRDTMQDAWALLSLLPEVAREQIETAARYIWADGEVARAWTSKGEGSIVRIEKKDLKLWIIIAVAEYMKTTGDFDILDTTSPFLESKNKKRHTLLTKLRRIAERAARDLGPHGLCLIGGGDWNDALDEAGTKGKGESIWLTQAVVYTFREFAGILAQTGDRKSAAAYRRKADTLAKRVNQKGWDGKWYLQAYDDAGRVIGSHKNKEGSCYLMPQAWALISGVASPARARTVIKSIKRVMMTDLGPLVMRHPYTKYDPTIGRLSQLSPGMCENGAVWCHAAAFTIRGLLATGYPEEAMDVFRRLSPFNHDPAVTYAEPYIYSNMYRGKECGEDMEGRSFVGWKTSTGGCLYLAFLECLFGIRPDYDGLRISPSIPKKWKKCSITGNYRNAAYAITIRNPHGKGTKVKRIEADGARVKDGLIPWYGDGKTHNIDVCME